MYRAAADTLAFATGGAQALKVSGSGIVFGEGDLVNAQFEMRKANDGGGVNLAITNQAGGVSSSTNETTAVRFYHGQAGTSASGANIVEMGKVLVGRESTNENDAATDGFMAFHTTQNNTMGERVRIHSNGMLTMSNSIGINVTDPDSYIEIKSDGANSQGFFRIRNSNDTQMFEFNNDSSGVPHLNIGNAAGSTKIQLRSIGSSIATNNSGDYALFVNQENSAGWGLRIAAGSDNGDYMLRMQNAGGSDRFDVRSDGAINTVMSTDGGDALTIDLGVDNGSMNILQVKEAGNDRFNLLYQGNGNKLNLNSNTTNNLLHIESDGKLGIGTSSPRSKFHVEDATNRGVRFFSKSTTGIGAGSQTTTIGTFSTKYDGTGNGHACMVDAVVTARVSQGANHSSIRTVALRILIARSGNEGGGDNTNSNVSIIETSSSVLAENGSAGTMNSISFSTAYTSGTSSSSSTHGVEIQAVTNIDTGSSCAIDFIGLIYGHETIEFS